jgi:iron complex transport system ATP-binding protein
MFIQSLVRLSSYKSENIKHTTYIGEINLIGEGIAAIWTIRALKRVGFTVLEGSKSTQITVEVISKSKQVCWKVTSYKDVSIHYSLYEVIKTLDLSRDYKHHQINNEWEI